MNYYFKIVPDIVENRTIKEDTSIHQAYHIKPLIMKDFNESVMANLISQFGRLAILRVDSLKISLLFGLFYGVFTKGSNELVGWISTTYAGEVGSLYVDPKHRRNGLAHSLWEFNKHKANENKLFTSSYVKQPPKEENADSGENYVSFSGVFGFKNDMSKL